MTVVLDKLRKLENLAAADAAGNPKAHGELLKGIGDLLLAAETPIEKTSRLNFQVRMMQHCPQLLCEFEFQQRYLNPQPLQNICTRIAVEKGWLHTIAARDGEPVTAMQLSATTSTDKVFIGELIQAKLAFILVEPL